VSDGTQFAAAVERLLGDADLREQLVERAVARVQADFDLATVCRRYRPVRRGMAAGVHGRERIGRSLSAARDVASLPGWIQLFVIVAVAAAIVLIAHIAGVPGRWAPMVIGGALGLMTALVGGAPRREDGEG